MAKQQCVSPISISKTACDEFNSSLFPILKTGVMTCNIRIRYKVQGTRFKNVSDMVNPKITKLKSSLLLLILEFCSFIHYLACLFNHGNSEQSAGRNYLQADH